MAYFPHSWDIFLKNPAAMHNFIWPNSKKISRQMDGEKDRF